MSAFIDWSWLSVAALTSASFGTLSATSKFIFMGFKRYRTAREIPIDWFKQQKILKGVAVYVGDGDNVRLYHRPFLFRLFGIGKNPVFKKGLSNETISIRLAGVDAPECPHFGTPGQRGGEEAKKWLRKYVTHCSATVKLHSLDQYSRAVCSVYVRKGFFRLKKNVSYELVKHGHAVVYRGMGAEYNGMLQKLEKAEQVARLRRKGMWKNVDKKMLSPAEYKRALREGRLSDISKPAEPINFFSRAVGSIFSVFNKQKLDKQ
eukprot:jgi/Galph1/5802/GphlegSOOS_G4436.1